MKLTLLTTLLALESTTLADLKGFDISQPQSTSFWTCMRNAGYRKVNIRAYFQSCGSEGGDVDPNFLTSYHAAIKAGFSAPNEIDAYMFPCTGTQAHARCQSPQAQINQLLAMLKDNKVEVHHLWLDVEPGNSECNAWNLAKQDNLNLAKEWTATLRKTSLKWGIYGNENSDIGSDLPLIAVIDDGKAGVSTVPESRLMGGWETGNVVAKQYNLDTKVCGGGVVLDSFLDWAFLLRNCSWKSVSLRI